MATLSYDVTIPARYCGPPGSSNGGYISGLVSRPIDGPAVVTLKSPPPLDTPMRLDVNGSRTWLYHGMSPTEKLIAHAESAPLSLDVPALPDKETLLAHSLTCDHHHGEEFDGCFVCGVARAEGDGLRIFASRLPDGGDVYAAPWHLDTSLADETGMVRPEMVWAALDCPGYWAIRNHAGYALLGRFHVRIDRPLRADGVAIVAAWGLESAGRKHGAGTALFDSEGQLVAVARALWITVDKARMSAMAHKASV